MSFKKSAAPFEKAAPKRPTPHLLKKLHQNSLFRTF
jgi:hypothetical protein